MGLKELQMGRVKSRNNIISVLGTRFLNEFAYVLRLGLGGLPFEAGQYISLGLPGNSEKREYTIYSGMNDEYLEVLVKEIDKGLVSKQLKHLQAGAHVGMESKPRIHCKRNGHSALP